MTSKWETRLNHILLVTSCKKGKFYVYFSQNSTAKPILDPTLEHILEKPHLEESIPLAAVRSSFTPPRLHHLRYADTSKSEKVRPSTYSASKVCEKYYSLLQTNL
ncbi:hypothetical protein CDAR_482901 [Caerostris darwini]|uniref:Uncharacterized protein n=1 Tax=Caerostris darwini TaxID=1538125 RepID=A0AAV4UYE5_9ARAC|nr:hypothetical protein CDAR_482901 [Caerostris darwini]